MLSDFFVNLLLLVCATFVGGHILKDISVKKYNRKLFKILTGIYCGLTGILLILYSVRVEEANSMIDLRVFAVMMASYVGGLIPSVISGIMIILFRIAFYQSNSFLYIVLFQVISLVVIYYIIDKIIKNSLEKWAVKTAFSLIVESSTYFIQLRKTENVILTIFEFSIMFILAGVLEYLLLEYVRTTNEMYRKYKHDSTKDFLTGLTNTRQFDKKLNMAFERVQQNNEKLSCLMVDIDFFKKINDNYGHAIGDLVLKELADILKKCIKTTDIVARVGGEEFCALLFNCSKEETFQIALNINKAVKVHKFPIGDNKFTNITVSVGVSIYPEMTDNLETLKELADTALYKAKRSGRDRVCDNDRCILSK